MKEVKLDWESYVEELDKQYKRGYSEGGIYAIKAMKAGEPYPEDIAKVLEELDAAANDDA